MEQETRGSQISGQPGREVWIQAWAAQCFKIQELGRTRCREEAEKQSGGDQRVGSESQSRSFTQPAASRGCRVRLGDSEEHKAFPGLGGGWEKRGVCVHGAVGIGGVASETRTPRKDSEIARKRPARHTELLHTF